MTQAFQIDPLAKTSVAPAATLMNLTRFRQLADIIHQKNSDHAPEPENYQAAVINFRLPLNGYRKIHFD